MRCFPMLSTTSFFARLAFVLLLTACGQKPDGTPYGVNPNKHNEGQAKPGADSAGGRATPYANGMPKGAELNAITNGASVGQPHSNQ